MLGEVIDHALNELPDEVVLVLSKQVRQEIKSKDPDIGAQGHDATYSGSHADEWRSADGEMSPGIVRKILAYSDLALGWKIARECAQRRIPLPAVLAMHGESIYRAFLYILDPKMFPDEAVEQALFMRTKAMEGAAADVQALIVANDTTPAEVSRLTGFRVDYLKVYENLFFNVSSRKADAAWLKNHVYPNTRMVEFYEDYVKNANYKMLLQRAGIKNGADHVLQLAGISVSPLDAMAASTTAAQLESFLLSQGLLMAQNGWANEASNSTAIFHSRHLMTAAKIGGEDTQVGSEYLDMSDSIWNEIVEVKRPQAERALRLQNAESIVDVSGIEL